ncbi:MAG: BON domain-containing protein [Pseudomonadota bacterium]|nr:BON domain-containing protein [Pseudomonadota bacterium]
MGIMMLLKNEKPDRGLAKPLRRARPYQILFVLVLLGTLPLSGCDSLFISAVATGGAAAVEERSIGDVVDDLTIRAELNQLFFKDNFDLLQSVSFSVIEGRVLLKGSVKTQKDRIRGLELAWQASGVREVINEIQVTDQGGIVNYARDTWISTQLKTEILFDMDILSINYNVETINGIIYVVGIAQDQAELDKVVNHARRIENVKQVVSHVVMKDDPRREPGP